MSKDWTETTIAKAIAFTSKPRNLDVKSFDQVPFVPMDVVPQDNTYICDCTWKPGIDIRSGNYFEKGDCLLAKITPCFENGKQGIARDLPADFGFASTELIPFRGRTGFSNKYFLFYFFLEPTTRRQIAQKMEGATGRQRIPISVLKNWPLSLPPLPEQKKIAAVLLKIQRAIETQDKIIQSLRDLKKSTMQHLFTHGLGGEKTKMTEIGEIPESWEVKKLRDICEKPTYGYTASASMEQVGPRFLRITDVTDRGVDWGTVPYCPCSDNQVENYRLLPDDILFARIGATTGKSYLVQEPPLAIYASYLIRVRAKPGVSARFLSYFFQTQFYWWQINANKHNNLKGGVNGSVLSGLDVCLPKMKPEQEQVAEVFETLDKYLQKHDLNKTALQDLFETTLNKLMTGNIRVADLKIDVKEVE